VKNWRRVKWTGHDICIGEMINVYKILETEHRKKISLGVDENTILKWILSKNYHNMIQWRDLVDTVKNRWTVLTAVNVKKIYILWDITPCSLVKVNRPFGHHLQGRRAS
jgi:hypothetical protein